MHVVTAIGLALSWRESDVVPQPADLREVTASLRTSIHRLLPVAELHGANLPAGSDEPGHRVIARVRALAALNIPVHPVKAVEHAVELGRWAGLFLSFAEQDLDPRLEEPGGTRAGAAR